MFWNGLSTGFSGRTVARFAATIFSYCAGWLLSAVPRKYSLHTDSWMRVSMAPVHYALDHSMDSLPRPKLLFLHSEDAFNAAKIETFRRRTTAARDTQERILNPDLFWMLARGADAWP